MIFLIGKKEALFVVCRKSSKLKAAFSNYPLDWDLRKCREVNRWGIMVYKF